MMRRSFLAMAGAATGKGGAAPLASFAVITDIHFADQPPLGKRDYRGSWERLARAVETINKAKPDFTIQLGDLVDSGVYSLARILPLYDALTMRRYHALGNHDFPNGRTELMRRLGMETAWYDFALDRWRFVVLDGMDISVAGRNEGTPEHAAAVAMLASLRAEHAPNAQDWNGAVGEPQMKWLREVLARARRQRERVVVFCHLPALRESSTTQHVAWNCDEIRAALDESGVVAAYLNGHDHNGGYAERGGIHFVTLPGMVESGVANSYTLVDVFDDRLELHGSGTAPSRTLALHAGRS
jgi:manganese-dependent ADP-ribose/CDP-alcohol diphosphatase